MRGSVNGCGRRKQGKGFEVYVVMKTTSLPMGGGAEEQLGELNYKPLFRRGLLPSLVGDRA